MCDKEQLTYFQNKLKVELFTQKKKKTDNK